MVIGGGGQSREGEVVTLIQKSVGVLSVPNKGVKYGNNWRNYDPCMSQLITQKMETDF